MNLLQIFPYFCVEIQKKGRAAGEALLKSKGFHPEVIAAASVCVSDDGKVRKADGSKMTMSDMMAFQHCI